jgi:hypothetical protein
MHVVHQNWYGISLTLKNLTGFEKENNSDIRKDAVI